MASVSFALDRTTSGTGATAPSSPHTPQRQTTLNYSSSPSVPYNVEPECVIFEIGCRHLSAGLAGEEFPRCRLQFGPEESRRVGDYRAHLPGYNEQHRKRRRLNTWGEGHELWDMDLDQCDLNFFQDKLERALRDAYTRYLLLEAKSKKVCLILPSVMPHRLLDRVLAIFFEGFSVPGVTLLTSPPMAAMGCGLRGGLVVDIGWKETVVTAVYEYREIRQSRTTRAMKLVTQEMAMMLDKCEGHEERRDDESLKETYASVVDADEVTARMAWCNPRIHSSREKHSDPSVSPNLIDIPSIRDPTRSLAIAFESFSEPVERSLFTPLKNFHDLDDHDQPLPSLIFKSLTRLPPDIRAYCMSRIIFIGGGSRIPGLKSRTLDELKAMVEDRGFDAVEGKVAEERREKLREISGNVTPRATPNILLPLYTKGQPPPPPLDGGKKPKKWDVEAIRIRLGEMPIPETPAPFVPYRGPAHQRQQSSDTITDGLVAGKAKFNPSAPGGFVRGVETLGPWAGASQLCKLGVKGVVDIERDAYLQHGLAGARSERAAEEPVKRDRRSYAADLGKGVEKGTWTLGQWA